MESEVRNKLRSIFFQDKDGWKFCSSKATAFTEKFKAMILDDLGNHPIGEYEYIDDCACMLNGGDSSGCGCDCHVVIERLLDKIMKVI